jgi:SAM-dependent MidA family methyltransferase
MTGPSRAELEIRRHIAERGAVPFVEFMSLALYHPDDGYYTRPDASTGKTGDFSTSSDVSPAFGRRLAVQAADTWARLGGGPWRIVELGPGRGLLAADLFAGLAEFAPDAHAALEELILIEVGPGLAAQQVARVAAADARVRSIASLAELPDVAIRGFVVGNEFLDALPTNWLVRRGSELVERHVAIDEAGALVPIDGPLSDERLAVRADRYGLCRRDGDQAEVCVAMEPVLAEIGRVLDAGAVVFVDYGHPAARLADEDHTDGTLLAYHDHRVEHDLLARPGRQDLTAHVNWDHLADAARDAGLDLAGRTTQDKFLLALGIVEDMLAPEDPALDTPAALARRLAARSLVMPGAGGGKRFEAACFVRGIAPDLRGLADPFGGGRL